MYTNQYMFRAWDRRKKSMLSWKKLQRYNLDLLFNRKRFIMMESTGYSDKNLIALYEYDIVQDHENRVGVVIRSMGEFIIRWRAENYVFKKERLTDKVSQKITVIGNRYQKSNDRFPLHCL